MGPASVCSPLSWPGRLTGLLALVACACSGSILQPSEEEQDPSAPGAPGNPGDPSSPGSPGRAGTGPSPESPNIPGPAPLRRLTIREYNNTVRDLLGVDSAPARDFAIDQSAGGFAVGGPVATASDAGRLLDAALSLAAAATDKLQALVPCTPVPPEAAAQTTCAQKFITQFGRRAYRRPLGADETAELQALYSAHRQPEIGYGFTEAIRAVAAAMLASPQFLYRAELGGAAPLRDAGLIRFNSHEMASRLSYSLWTTMPDEELFREADAGKLVTPDQIDRQVRRMLKDPRATEAVADFHLQWLDIDTLPGAPPKEPRFKEYTPELVSAMVAETVAFTTDLLLGARATGSFEALFTSPATFVNDDLARLYGTAAPAGAGGMRAATLNAEQRAGVLTHASFLAMHASTGESDPVKRGTSILKRVLCIDIPPPPDMDVGMPKPPAPGLTTRQRFAEHSKQECATCHRLSDPVGFAFEHYDAIGAFRTQDQGQPVDASGVLELPSGPLRFKDAVELVKALSRTPEAQQCMATQWLRFFLRRTEMPGDKASLAVANTVFAGTGHDIRELLVALSRSRAFTHRTASAGEVSP